jgi:geranylgeranyl diphosphate synthase, type II
VRDPVAPLLVSYGSAAYSTMLTFLPSADPKSDVQKYLYGPLGEYPRRRGKLIRACLCIAAACAYSGKMTDAVNTAVAIELLHNASLVHDDIEDGAPTRRRGVALHDRHGPELAVNAGDALFLLALRPLLRNFDTLDRSLAARLLTEFDWTAWQTVEGQAMELGWRRDNRMDASVADYFTMAMKKTAWLGMILPLRAGVLIATGGAADPNRVIDFGFYLGCLFQIINDIGNLVDPQNRVKHDFPDLFEGKRSLILAHAISRSTLREKDEISQVYRKPRAQRSGEDTGRIYELILKYKSIEFAKSTAGTMAEAATDAFASTFGHLGPSPDKEFIFGLIGYFSTLMDAH